MYIWTRHLDLPWASERVNGDAPQKTWTLCRRCWASACTWVITSRPSCGRK